MAVVYLTQDIVLLSAPRMPHNPTKIYWTKHSFRSY